VVNRVRGLSVVDHVRVPPLAPVVDVRRKPLGGPSGVKDHARAPVVRARQVIVVALIQHELRGILDVVTDQAVRAKVVQFLPGVTERRKFDGRRVPE